MVVTIGNGTLSISINEAKEVIAGYAFGQIPLQWKSDRQIPSWAGNPATYHRYAFSYMAYDNIPPASGPLSAEDLLVTAGIESQISSRGTNAIMAISSLIQPDVTALRTAPPFWNLNVTRLGTQPTAIRSDPEYHLWRAWHILKEPKWSGPAVAHKVLHHKLPNHVPLVDNQIVKIYGSNQAWTGIWYDLYNNQEFFVALENWFMHMAKQVGKRDTRSYVPLSRLRLIDILLWTHRTSEGVKVSNWDLARRLGKVILHEFDAGPD